MRVVVALGDSALIRRGHPPDGEAQRLAVKAAASSISALAQEHEIVVTHGNGPQIGLLAAGGASSYPLDLLGAETEGRIGYLLEQEIENELPKLSVATLLTQTLVGADDPAFDAPTVPVGPHYPRAEGLRIAAERNWAVRSDGESDGEMVRRVVAAPEPQKIVELRTIRLLVAAGVVVICAGGGGIPVVRAEDGGLRGVEAVVDKDLAAAMLADSIEADMLLLLTDVPFVQRHWGTPQAHDIEETTPEELRAEVFAADSIGPKVEAACRFVENTGQYAAIGAVEDAVEVCNRTAGTVVVPASEAEEV